MTIVLINNMLVKCNDGEISIDDKHINIPIINGDLTHLDTSYVHLYNSQFTDERNISMFLKLMMMTVLLGTEKNKEGITYRNKYLKELLYQGYWIKTNMYNTNEQFKARDVNARLYSRENILVKNIGNKSLNFDYLSEIIGKKSNYLCSELSELSIPTIIDVKFSCDDLEMLYSYMSKDNFNILVLNMLKSYEYCHVPLKSSKLIDYLFETFNTEKLAQLISYAWITLSIKEAEKNAYASIDNDFIFTLNEANNLPLFKCYYNYNNPYMTALICTDFKKNTLHPPQCDGTSYGCVNLNTFVEKMNIFIFKRRRAWSIFNNMDWCNGSYGITGSVIPACLCNNHPYSAGKSPETYFNEYYTDSDIDIIIKGDDLYDYLDKIRILYNTILNNCKLYFGEEHNVEIKYKKSVNFKLNKSFIEKSLLHEGESVDDIISIIENPLMLSSKRYKEIEQVCFNHYNNNILHVENTDYPELNTSVSLDNLCVIMSKNDEFDIVTSIKAHITSKYFRTIEIFRCSVNTIIGAVSQFHYGMVRAYYDGTNIYMTPSCITSMNTLYSPDYRYFVSKKAPQQLWDKYWKRGWGCFYNTNELLSYSMYMSSGEIDSVGDLLKEKLQPNEIKYNNNYDIVAGVIDHCGNITPFNGSKYIKN